MIVPATQNSVIAGPSRRTRRPASTQTTPAIIATTSKANKIQFGRASVTAASAMTSDAPVAMPPRIATSTPAGRVLRRPPA